MDAPAFFVHLIAMTLIGQPITVLGGGIAGLAVARALALRGAAVTVLEQAAELTEVGAGLQITPNGARVLDALGLAERLRAVGLRSEAVELRDLGGGRVLRMGLDGANYFLVHRADLIALLADGAREAGVQVRLLQKIEEVSLSEEGAVLTTAQGARIDAPLLIGADGLNSVVRPALNGRVVPFFTRQVAWRATVPAPDSAPAQATVWMGPKRHVVTYPLRGGRLMNVVAVREWNRWAEESWSVEDDPIALRAEFEEAAPALRELLARVETVHLWGLFRHPVAKVWGRGRAAILGDAAHPTLPFLAQGANLALEDAWVLAAKLAEHGVPDGLAAYQAARADRAARVIEAANRNARNYHLTGPVAALGHGILRMAGAVAPGAMLRRFDWIYGYDATSV